ncbi:DUF3159 domain-containing protein [bacterium]|nr:DUF3159 domain-containing protein [bacterium]
MKSITHELKEVLFSRISLVDALVPTLLYTLFSWLTVPTWAAIITVASSLIFILYRETHNQGITYIIVGLAGVAISSVGVIITQNQNIFFLSSIVTDTLLALFSLVSLFYRIPVVALTSHLVRKWPLEWFRHEKVYPAYKKTTLVWVVFFSVRAIIVALTSGLSFNAVATINVLLGWPATIVLLLGTYVYGTKCLKSLKGPSVKEFSDNVLPPWKSQQSGF